MTTVEDVSVARDFPAVFNQTLSPDLVQEYAMVSYQTRQIFIDINYVYISGPLSFCGIVGNMINIVVFCKQGFKDSINISLLGLAIADFLSLLTVLWLSLCYGWLLKLSDLPFNTLGIMLLTGGYPHLCFNRVTSLITVFITLERCLCISMPFKVKTIFTSARTKIIIPSIFVIMILIFVPLYCVNKLEWNFNNALNKTLLVLVEEKYRMEVESVIYFIQGVFLSIISLFSVIICTVILIVNLSQKSRWRRTATGGTEGSCSQKPVVSIKEKKVVKMVTFISAIYIIFYVPAIFIIFVMVYEPELSFVGKYENIFFVVWSFALVLEATNSSVNILVYYNMSSKYKLTFTDMFCKCVAINMTKARSTLTKGQAPHNGETRGLKL